MWFSYFPAQKDQVNLECKSLNSRSNCIEIILETC